VGVVDLAEGDTLLLCSDGLTKHVSDERIAELLGGSDPESAAQALIDAALEGGGSDNVTVVVAKAVSE
jgi:serine/threonine protein phosphatase PrpC